MTKRGAYVSSVNFAALDHFIQRKTKLMIVEGEIIFNNISGNTIPVAVRNRITRTPTKYQLSFPKTKSLVMLGISLREVLVYMS